MSQVIELSTRGQTIPAALHRAARLNAELPFLSYMTKEKGEGKAERMKRVTLTFREFERRVNRVARFLYALNLPHGTAALVLSGNCPEWLVAEFAIFQAGMVLVPPYPTLKAEEVQYQIQHAGVKVAFVENQEQLNKLGDLDDPTLVRVVAFSEVTPHPKVALMGAISNDVLVSPEPLASSTLIDPSAKAVQIYTSGSSGVPKGVEHSHESLLANVDLLLRIPIFHAGQPISAILFFAHIYPLVTTVMAAVAGLHMILPGGVSRRARINPRAMMDALKFGDVELAVLVPQLLAKIKTGIEEKARSQGSTFLESKKNELIALTLEVSLTRYREKLYRRLEKHGKPLPEGFVRPTTEQRKKARLMFPLVSFLRKKIIAEVLGRKVRYIATGGSALAYQVGEFYEALGIEVIQGFGTTELGIPISQLPDGISGYVKVPGTVGSALDRAKVFYWIDPATSELIVSSPTIMMGYAGDPAKTSGVIEIINGRRAYHTGDFAREVGGSIELSGRIDRIYNNLGGEKVSPEGIEKRIEESPYVAYALVWGDGKTHNVAVISPEELSARAWAESRGLRFEDLATSEEFRREIERHIETNVNPNGRSWERVHGVIIADEPFSSANGLLTSSGKVRPKEVLRVYRDKIEALC